MSFFYEFLQVSIALIAVFCVYIKWQHGYWMRRGVRHLATTFPFGNSTNFLYNRENPGITMRRLYEMIKKKNWKYAGIVSIVQPSVLLVDPELIRCVLAKDFQCFMDRRFPVHVEGDPLSGHLVALKGAKWKKLRAKLTPTFTSGKMKMMFGNVVECSSPLQTILNTTKNPLEIKDLFGRFTTDVIGSCAFGLDCNSFKDNNNEFTKHCNLALKLSVFDSFRTVCIAFFPTIASIFGLKLTNPDVERFFMKVVKDTVDLRRSGYKRNDFMQLLVELMESEENPDGLTLEEVAAQAFIFFLAGFETSSTTGAFCMMELSRNEDVQNKVRQEIKDVLNKHGELTYEALQDMKYLGNVVDETLRMYPPLSFLTRECTQDYTFPDTDLHIPKGLSVMISSFGLQRDPDYFPNPDTFDPDRFSDENRQKMTPYTYLPFGEGPRVCIGMRFGLMQTKVGLVALLRDHKFRLNERTEFPLVFDPTGFMLSSVGGIWLDVEQV